MTQNEHCRFLTSTVASTKHKSKSSLPQAFQELLGYQRLELLECDCDSENILAKKFQPRSGNPESAARTSEADLATTKALQLLLEQVRVLNPEHWLSPSDNAFSPLQSKPEDATTGSRVQTKASRSNISSCPRSHDSVHPAGNPLHRGAK